MPSQQILLEKIGEVGEVIKLIRKYSVMGIADLQKVRAPQLQSFKKNLSRNVYMQVIKNTILKRAIEKIKEKPELNRLVEYLQGPNLFLFTDLNPFRLALLLEKGKVKTTAKAGDTAAFDVIVPTGNTGQAPGPIISQLNAVGLPTRIEAGSVWVTKDTLVIKRGEVISERLASILSKLGIKPVEAGLSMKVAYDGGLIISHKQLKIDPEEDKKRLKTAHIEALGLSLSIVYPTAENIKILLQNAHKRSYCLAIQVAIPNRGTILELIRKTVFESYSLSSKLSMKEKNTKLPEKLK